MNTDQDKHSSSLGPAALTALVLLTGAFAMGCPHVEPASVADAGPDLTSDAVGTNAGNDADAEDGGVAPDGRCWQRRQENGWSFMIPFRDGMYTTAVAGAGKKVDGAVVPDNEMYLAVARLDLQGHPVWSKHWAVQSVESNGKPPHAYRLALSPNHDGNYLISVETTDGQVDFGSGKIGALSGSDPLSRYHIFAQFDGNGNAKWAKVIGPGWGTGYGFGYMLEDSRALIVGVASKDLELAPSMVVHGTQDNPVKFLLSLDPQGQAQWIRELDWSEVWPLDKGRVEVLTTRKVGVEPHPALVTIGPDGSEEATVVLKEVLATRWGWSVVHLKGGQILWRITNDPPASETWETGWHSLVIATDVAGRVLWKHNMGQTFAAVHFDEAQCVGVASLRLAVLPSGGVLVYGSFCSNNFGNLGPRLMEGDPRVLSGDMDGSGYFGVPTRNSFVVMLDAQGNPGKLHINRLDFSWDTLPLMIEGDRVLSRASFSQATKPDRWPHPVWCDGKPLVPPAPRPGGTTIASAPLEWLLAD